jgi:hypothetical protein
MCIWCDFIFKISTVSEGEGMTALFLVCRAERRASSVCGTNAESKHPEDVSLTTLFQGVLSKLFIFSNRFAFPWIRRKRGSSGRIPWGGMAKETFSGSFDSSKKIEGNIFYQQRFAFVRVSSRLDFFAKCWLASARAFLAHAFWAHWRRLTDLPYQPKANCFSACFASRERIAHSHQSFMHLPMLAVNHLINAALAAECTRKN